MSRNYSLTRFDACVLCRGRWVAVGQFLSQILSGESCQITLEKLTHDSVGISCPHSPALNLNLHPAVLRPGSSGQVQEGAGPRAPVCVLVNKRDAVRVPLGAGNKIGLPQEPLDNPPPPPTPPNSRPTSSCASSSCACRSCVTVRGAKL